MLRKPNLTELESKIQDVSSLAKKTVLTAVENKIPDVSSLVNNNNNNNNNNKIVIIIIQESESVRLKKKLVDHNHDKYITTPEFNTLAACVFNSRLAQTNFITKMEFDAKLSSLNRKITSNSSKNLLVENELKKLKTFDSSYFIGKSHFEENGTQNYLVFQPMYRYFKRVVGVGASNYIYFWKSKGLHLIIFLILH